MNRKLSLSFLTCLGAEPEDAVRAAAAAGYDYIGFRLLAATPAAFKQDAHHWLILHGRYICTARRPRCAACPIRDLCQYPHKLEES